MIVIGSYFGGVGVNKIPLSVVGLTSRAAFLCLPRLA